MVSISASPSVTWMRREGLCSSSAVAREEALHPTAPHPAPCTTTAWEALRALPGPRSLLSQPAKPGLMCSAWLSAVGWMMLALQRMQLQPQDFRAAVGCRQGCSSWEGYLKGTSRGDKMALKQTNA